MASPLRDMTGMYLAVDCGAPDCRGERTYAVAALARSYGEAMTMAGMIQRMRCAGCGGHVRAACIVTGPGARLAGRVPLLGAEVRE